MHKNFDIKIEQFFELVEQQIKLPSDFFNWDKNFDNKKIKSKNTIFDDVMKILKEKNNFKIILFDSHIYQPFDFLIKKIKFKFWEEKIKIGEISPDENFISDNKK